MIRPKTNILQLFSKKTAPALIMIFITESMSDGSRNYKLLYKLHRHCAIASGKDLIRIHMGTSLFELPPGAVRVGCLLQVIFGESRERSK